LFCCNTAQTSFITAIALKAAFEEGFQITVLP
jgi:hypothetical protein